MGRARRTAGGGDGDQAATSIRAQQGERSLASGISFNGGGVVADGRLLLTSVEDGRLKLWAIR